MTATTTPPGRPSGTGFFATCWNAVRNFLAIKVRMWVFLAAAVVVAGMIAAIAEGVKQVDRSQREADARAAAQVAYGAALRTYDLEVRERADCLAAVTRSDANRGQHEALVSSIERLFPDSEVARTIVADLRAGPLLSAPPRTVEDCPPEPVQPVPPVELIGVAL